MGEAATSDFGRNVSGTPTAWAMTVEHPMRSQKEKDSPTCCTLNTACTMKATMDAVATATVSRCRCACSLTVSTRPSSRSNERSRRQAPTDRKPMYTSRARKSRRPMKPWSASTFMKMSCAPLTR